MSADEEPMKRVIRQEAAASESDPDAPLQPGTKIHRPGNANAPVLLCIEVSGEEMETMQARADLLELSVAALAPGWLMAGLAVEEESEGKAQRGLLNRPDIVAQMDTSHASDFPGRRDRRRPGRSDAHEVE